MLEKRVHQRKLMNASATLGAADGGARYPVVMLDISRLGVSFIHTDKLGSGASHFLDFRLPGSDTPLEAVVQVVHSTADGTVAGYRVGARFVYIAPETGDAIEAFMARLDFASE